jgi:hypothetical protein
MEMYFLTEGRAIAQAVSCWLPTAAAWVLGEVMWDLWWKNGTWAGFLQVLWFPLPILIPPIAPHPLSSIIRGWYKMPNTGRYINVLKSHLTQNTKKKLLHRINTVSFSNHLDHPCNSQV